MYSTKILSIDWDYFIDCPIDFKRSNFPDGGNENLPEFILDQIWVTRYGECPKLKEVKTDLGEITKLRMLLKSLVNPYTTVVITDSHKEIYKYLEEFRQTKFPMELYNVDFHHDVYDFQSDEVDCGNWLRMFMNTNSPNDRNSITWIRREDSELSGWEAIDRGSLIGIPRDMDTPFQLVFLCRSGVWSPPHLDREFLSLCRFISKLGSKTPIIDPKIMRNRYNRQFKDSVKQHADIIKKIKENLENSQD